MSALAGTLTAAPRSRPLTCIPPPHPLRSAHHLHAPMLCCRTSPVGPPPRAPTLSFLGPSLGRTGRTPLDVARLEGHLGIAAVLEGMRNRHSNDLHSAFTANPLFTPKAHSAAMPCQCGSDAAASPAAAGTLSTIAPAAAAPALAVGASGSPSRCGTSGSGESSNAPAAQREEQQIALIRCRPDLASQRDAAGNLPVHLAALHGATLAAVAECVRIFPDGPRMRNDAGFLPHQLALEGGHAALAEELAAAAGRRVPPRRINSVLARAANVQKHATEALPAILPGAPTATGGSVAAATAGASGHAIEGDSPEGRGAASSRGVGGGSIVVEGSGGSVDAYAAAAEDGGGSADGDTPVDAEGTSAAKAMGKLSIAASVNPR